MNKKAKTPKIYLIINGRKPGIYKQNENWQEQIRGYPDYLMKGFRSLTPALEWVRVHDINHILDETKIRKAFEKQKETLKSSASSSPTTTDSIKPITSTEAEIKQVFRSPLKIYTDGSVLDNPTAGGWAGIIVIADNICLKIKGRKKNPKDSTHMELIAIHKTLKYIEKHNWNLNDACVFTDSQPIVDAWMKNVRPENGPRKVWKKVWKRLLRYNISLQWVKGHAGNIFNETCDKLAKEAASEQSALKIAKTIDTKKKVNIA